MCQCDADTDLDLDMEELSSAEDFLTYFKVAFEPAVVQVNRLHIMQRMHDYLARSPMPTETPARFRHYHQALRQAYQDFVESDALTEKVFKVFRMHEPQESFVSLTSITVVRE